MTNEDFIKDVIFGLMGKIPEPQLVEIKECLTIKLHGKEIVEHNFELLEQTTEETNLKAFNRFKADLIISKMSPKTITQYERQFKKFFEYIDKPYCNVSKDDITIYLLHLSQKGLSDSTVLNSRRFIAPFFNWLAQNNYINKNPFVGVKKQKTTIKEKIVLTEQEQEIIKDACNTLRETALVDFLLSTGVRVGELSNIKIDDVDFINGTVKVFANKTHNYRYVFLSPRANKHLVDYIKSLPADYSKDGSLFPNRYGVKCSSKTFEELIHNICIRTNISKNVTVHTFRKTLATNLLHKGCSPTTISIILGHKSFSTTSKYYCNFNQNDIKNEFMRCA